MIPKIINYCWFGNSPKNKVIEKCINSWRKYCPEYEIKEWNEQNFDININTYVKEAYEKKKWAFVSDYARLWIVYNYGGIYLDTDVELIRNIDDLLNNNSFFSSEYAEYINTGLGFGAEKGNLIIKELIEDYNKSTFLDENRKYDRSSLSNKKHKNFEKDVSTN